MSAIIYIYDTDVERRLWRDGSTLAEQRRMRKDMEGKVKVVKIMIYWFAIAFIPHSAQLIPINIKYKKLDIFVASE